MSPSMALIAALALAAQETDAADPLAAARTQFLAADTDVQLAVLASIRAKIARDPNAEVQALLKLRDRALAEAKPEPFLPPRWYEVDEYAPGLDARSFVDRETSNAMEQYGIMRPWENEPQFAARYRYDFARNRILELAPRLSAEQEIDNYLTGYVPDADLLSAWLELGLDYDAKLDPVAEHFAHAYCDRVGNCYQDITIYDAYAAGGTIEMSDVDVIAFARLILKDDSFHTPIPTNQRQAKLYEDINQNFLRYFRHRTLVEAVANLRLNPDYVLRDKHENLRHWGLLLLALDGGDLEKVRKRLEKAASRDALIDELKRLEAADPAVLAKRDDYVARLNGARWAVANVAYSVLREQGFLQD